MIRLCKTDMCAALAPFIDYSGTVIEQDMFMFSIATVLFVAALESYNKESLQHLNFYNLLKRE